MKMLERIKEKIPERICKSERERESFPEGERTSGQIFAKNIQEKMIVTKNACIQYFTYELDTFASQVHLPRF